MNSKKIRFATLFPKCPNYGLVKDVGQIPYILGKDNNEIETRLVSSEINFDGDNLKEVKGLLIERIPYVFNSEFITGLIYLMKSSRSIDWLNIYHCGRKTYYWTRLYKLINPKGKVYLKLDLDFVSCEKYDNNLKERKLFKKVTSVMDLVSIESRAVYERIKDYTDSDIKLISNGYCSLVENVDVTCTRENVFITVGRLGTKQKATEILLEAFAKTAQQHDWKLILVGSVEPEFESIKKNYYEENPELIERVIFTGSIDDRRQLYEMYSNSKVMVLPSRWESFGLVAPEAISCGCRLIVSNQVPSMYEVTCEEKYGAIVPAEDVETLAEAMLDATKYKYTKEEAQEIANYAQEHFSWEKICEKIKLEMSE